MHDGSGACFVAPTVVGRRAVDLGGARAASARRSGRAAVRASSAAPGRRPARRPWPVGRFARTLLWYSPLGQMLRPRAGAARLPAHDIAPPSPPPRTGRRVLVSGASGRSGRRIVRALLDDGTTVRALVRDEQKGIDALRDVGIDVDAARAAGTLEFVVTDLYSLTPEVFDGVDAVISATGARVGPAPTDGAAASDAAPPPGPVILGDTPENVEYRGVKALAEGFAKSISSRDKGEQSASVRILVHDDPEEVAAFWGVLDDVVMGGVSSCGVSVVDGKLRFAGEVSTANFGGFSSIRSAELPSPLDLSDFDGLQMRVKGDGRRYKFIVRCDSKWDGNAHCFSFDTVAGEWIDVRIPFSAFNTVFRSKTLPEGPPLDPSHVSAFQIMYSKFEYDNELNPAFEPGRFELLLDTVYAYKAVYPRFVHLSSCHVMKVFRQDQTPEDAVLPIVKLQKSLGRLLEWKLAGEDAIRASLSGVGYTIVRATSFNEKQEAVGLQSLLISQGDTIDGRISRDDVARILVEAMYLPMSSKTVEVGGATADGGPVASTQDFHVAGATLKKDKDATERRLCAFPYVPK